MRLTRRRKKVIFDEFLYHFVICCSSRRHRREIVGVCDKARRYKCQVFGYVIQKCRCFCFKLVHCTVLRRHTRETVVMAIRVPWNVRWRLRDWIWNLIFYNSLHSRLCDTWIFFQHLCLLSRKISVVAWQPCTTLWHFFHETMPTVCVFTAMKTQAW